MKNSKFTLVIRFYLMAISEQSAVYVTKVPPDPVPVFSAFLVSLTSGFGWMLEKVAFVQYNITGQRK